MQQKLLLPLVILCSLGWQASANAHRTDLTYRSTEAFEINATHGTGEPMANAQVVVYSPQNSADPWQSGTTDAKGRFLFAPDAPGNWKVQVRQAGHGKVLTIPVQAAVAPTAVTPTAPSAIVPTTTDSVAETAAIQPADDYTYTPLQKGIMIAAVVWGCIGTALFFMRGKKEIEVEG